MIPFSPPHIDQKIVDEVTKVLLSGWITTGPRTKLFEKELTKYCGNKATLCLNSANVVMHCGAKPVFVDVNAHDFNISIANIEKAITSNTKVIMPVDFGGHVCDYDELNALVLKHKDKFSANTEEQKMLGRILVLSDSAHSFGATYKGKKAGSLTDISVFSFFS